MTLGGGGVAVGVGVGMGVAVGEGVEVAVGLGVAVTRMAPGCGVHADAASEAAQANARRTTRSSLPQAVMVSLRAGVPRDRQPDGRNCADEGIVADQARYVIPRTSYLWVIP